MGSIGTSFAIAAPHGPVQRFEIISQKAARLRAERKNNAILDF